MILYRLEIFCKWAFIALFICWTIFRTLYLRILWVISNFLIFLDQLTLRNTNIFIIFFNIKFHLFWNSSNTDLFSLYPFLIIGEIHNLITMLELRRGRTQWILIRIISYNRIMDIRFPFPSLILPHHIRLRRYIYTRFIRLPMDTIQTVNPSEITACLLTQSTNVICVIDSWIRLTGQLGVVWFVTNMGVLEWLLRLLLYFYRGI